MSRGRVEILACYDEIVYLLDSGNTYRYIHDFLYKNNKISISYLHFCSLLRRFKIRKRQDEILKPVYDAQSELDKIIHKVKKIQKQVIYKQKTEIKNYSLPLYKKITELTDDSFGIIKKPEDEVF